MKIQCACGAKYSFDVSPEMAATPVQFVCPSCNLDSSAMVNQLIQQEFSEHSEPPQPIAASTTEQAPGTAAPSSLRIRSSARPTAPVEQTAAPEARPCLKHPGQFAAEHCLICNKPICPKCMELFGYVCSAYCKAKAEAAKIPLPVYGNQRAVVEAKHWQKAGRITMVAVLLIAVLLGSWIWYEFFGSRPKVAFATKFPDISYAGQCFIVDKDQLAILRGGKLSRYDMKTGKEIWSIPLLDKKKFADDAAANLEQMKKNRDRAIDQGMDPDDWRLPGVDEMIESAERAAIASMKLHVKNQRVWVGFPGKLVSYDWETGTSSKEIALNNQFNRLIPKGNELLLVEETLSGQRITHIDLSSGDLRGEEISGTKLASLDAAALESRKAPEASSLQNAPLDPAQIAARVQSLPLPAKLALPATVATAANQERALAEMRDKPQTGPKPAASARDNSERFTLVPDANGFLQFSVRLVESKFITRTAMKAAPTKSALSGNVNASRTADVANELLNEMQRDRGGDTVQEDVSRYHVKFRRAGSEAEWSGEVVGQPRIFPQKTIVALTAGKSISVFDQSAKKLWDSTLNYEVIGAGSDDYEQEDAEPPSPCVERGKSLYVFDQGVLSAFDLATGQPRWRLPSVGISRIHFDEDGMLYANTTTATPDNIRYSRQIDVRDKISSAIIKVDPSNGKLLWQIERKGHLNYVSGKFLYSVDIQQGDEYAELDEATKIFQAFKGAPHIFIWRINAKNGKVMWEHYQERPPLDVHFDKNSIQLLFKKEAQVLTFFSL